MAQIYLDHQAGTPLRPEVFEAMRPFLAEQFGNVSSLHRYGLQARDALGLAREQLAALIGAETPEDIIFTSGGTEAVNLAVKGTAYAGKRRGNHIVVSAIEHPAVLSSVEFLEQEGFRCTRVPVDRIGRVDPAAVKDALSDQTILICVHHVNHDIGTVEPIAEIAAVATGRGVPLFVDAVASAGWLPIDVQAMGASLLALSPHRFYGPKGVGVLYRHRRARIVPIQHGGVQEGGRRAGTENVPAIVGAGVAARLAQAELPSRMKHTAVLQRRLWEGLAKKIPCLVLNGPKPGPERIGTNLNLSIEFIEGEGLALLCDINGIAVASGAACVSKAIKASPVLTAIGLEASLAQANIILTLGEGNTIAEIDHVIDKLPKLVERLRGMSPMWDAYLRGEVSSAVAGS